jgi:hypothetical protein
MRAIRTAVKGLGAVAVLVAVMAVPSVAAASPMYWAEYDGDPIDTVTVDVTGTIDVELVNAGGSGSADCDVTGEVELTNDWSNPGGPATQKIINLQPAVSGSSSCTGQRSGCPVSDVTYSSPWSGTTAGYLSNFDNVRIDMEWACLHGGPAPLSVAGEIDMAAPNDVPVGENWCTGDFQMADYLAGVQFGGGWGANVSGLLEFDLNTLEGLEDDDAGPCVMILDY